ncbi:MAG: NADPH-dependent F420 reductase [Deltaproteobacteria bacterium]|nr:NADPH-dependent F420 reductase [Deltaproteobacteria bacterium]
MELEKDVSIAIVGGTGNLGQGLAVRLAAPGIKVIIGSRDPEKARTVVESIRKASGKEGIEGKGNQEAVREAELVVIAVPYEGHSKMVTDLRDQIGKKIVIDAVVPLKKGKPFIPPAGSALLEAQEILGTETPVVGALHNISAGDLQEPDAPLGDVLVCGDSKDAKERVMGFIQKLGARAFDAGPAANAYIIEGLTGVLIHLNRRYKSKHASVKVTGIGD